MSLWSSVRSKTYSISTHSTLLLKITLIIRNLLFATTHKVWLHSFSMESAENGPHSMSLQASILAQRQPHTTGHISGCFHMNTTYYRQCQHSQRANKAYTYGKKVKREPNMVEFGNRAHISLPGSLGSVNHTQWLPTCPDLIKSYHFPSLISHTRNSFHFIS